MGVSIGIERVFAILERRLTAQAKNHGAAIRETQTQASAHTDPSPQSFGKPDLRGLVGAFRGAAQWLLWETLCFLERLQYLH